MTETTARFSLPFIMPAQAQKHLTHNDALRVLDLFLHLCIQDDTLITPPETVHENDAYIIPDGAIDEWSGRINQIAVFWDGTWQFFVPAAGWVAWIKTTQKVAVFDGNAWTISTTSGGTAVGPSGKSAYDIAVENGFEGTQSEWLTSLVGADGQNGADGKDGLDGATGPSGQSAYDIAVANGYEGTQTQWLASLVGATGLNGTDGRDGLDGATGPSGQSAYDIAIANGYEGTQTQWLASLQGRDGTDAAAKPFAHAINTDSTIVINSANPETVLSAQITLTQPGTLLISGTLMGTFSSVCGVACYLNDAPISIANGSNQCHDDCFMILYGNGSDNFCCAVPFSTTTQELVPGTYTVRIAALSRWNGTSRNLFMNNRSQADMASSSTLTVRVL